LQRGLSSAPRTDNRIGCATAAAAPHYAQAKISAAKNGTLCFAQSLPEAAPAECNAWTNRPQIAKGSHRGVVVAPYAQTNPKSDSCR